MPTVMSSQTFVVGYSEEDTDARPLNPSDTRRRPKGEVQGSPRSSLMRKARSIVADVVDLRIHLTHLRRFDDSLQSKNESDLGYHMKTLARV